ncbi:MAG: DUF4215 domain-containing protein [Gammaproteobacteria bacterium]
MIRERCTHHRQPGVGGAGTQAADRALAVQLRELELCGDGITQASETCDDWNNADGDGSALCNSDETCGNSSLRAELAVGGAMAYAMPRRWSQVRSEI